MTHVGHAQTYQLYRGEVEWQRFTKARISLARRGIPLPCDDQASAHLWKSEDPGERERAAALCLDCPVMVKCGVAAMASGEHFAVYGGVDLTAAGYGSMTRRGYTARGDN